MQYSARRWPRGPGALACDARGAPLLASLERAEGGYDLCVWSWEASGWTLALARSGFPFGHPFAAWDAARGDVVVGLVDGSLAGPHGPIMGPWGIPPPGVHVRFFALARPDDVRVGRQDLQLVRRAVASTASRGSGRGILLQLAAADKSRTLLVAGNELRVLGEPRRPVRTLGLPPLTLLPREAPELVVLDERVDQMIGTSDLGAFRKTGTASTWTIDHAVSIETSMWKRVEAGRLVAPLAFDPRRGVVVGFRDGVLVGFVDGGFRAWAPEIRAPFGGDRGALFADRVHGGLVAYGPSTSMDRWSTWRADEGEFVRVSEPAPAAAASDDDRWPVDALTITRGTDVVSAFAVPVVVPDGATLVASVPAEVCGIARTKTVAVFHGPAAGDVRVSLLDAPAPAALRDDARGELVAITTEPFEDRTPKAGDKIGGKPRWLRPRPPPSCPKCTRTMTFVLQLEKRGERDAKMRLFAFACPGGCSGAGLVQT